MNLFVFATSLSGFGEMGCETQWMSRSQAYLGVYRTELLVDVEPEATVSGEVVFLQLDPVVL